MDGACQEILMGTGITLSSKRPYTSPGWGSPWPPLWSPGSRQGPVPGPLSSRTLTPHSTQNSVLASFPADLGVPNRRNLAPDPDSAPRSPRPLAAPGGPSSGGSGPLDRGTLRIAVSRLLLCRPPEAAQAGVPGGLWALSASLATGRQWRRLLQQRRRRRVSHAAGAREPAPPPPSGAAA